MNMSPDKKQDEPSTPTAFDVGQVNESSHDAVFGTITEDGPNYRSVCVPCDSSGRDSR
jgi:hypothetical protein